jgi:UDP-N-acetylmuramyl pentapeptide phosphotransferase/UDP-N-acetylglucosamine-1-phosphate transferase
MLLAAWLAWAMAWLGTRWAIRHAHLRGLHDQPGERRSHVVPTPRGGGIGIVLAGLFGLLVLAVTANDPWPWLLIAAGLLLVAGIGWWDDHRPLSAWPRLVVHVCAGVLLALATRSLGGDLLASIGAFVLAVGLVNAWNFMDGIDGLAASQALLCGIAIAACSDASGRLLGLLLAAACIGFLPSNFPRAKVFLGDVGSGALGYLVTVLLVQGWLGTAVSMRALLLLPPLAMLVDSATTLLWRIMRGDRWWQAHVQHAYQRWSRRIGHVSVTLMYALWTLLVSGFMLWAMGSGNGWSGLA